MSIFRQQSTVQIQHAIRAAIQGEFGPPACLPGFAEARAQCRIIAEVANCRCKHSRVARRDEQPAGTVGDDVTHARSGDRCRDHRQARAHRLEQDDAEGFGALDRRQAEYLGLRIGQGELRVVDMAGETYTMLDAQLARQRAQAGLAFAAADQEQTRFRRERECAQQHVETLVIAQAADGEQAQARARPCRGLCRSIFCRNFHFFNAAVVRWRLADPQRHDMGLAAPGRKRGARIAIRRRGRDDRIRAPQQCLLERAVERVHRAQRGTADVERHVGMPVHEPGQAPCGGCE